MKRLNQIESPTFLILFVLFFPNAILFDFEILAYSKFLYLSQYCFRNNHNEKQNCFLYKPVCNIYCIGQTNTGRKFNFLGPVVQS